MMNQEQLKELVEQLEQERNGDKEHDREVLMRWLENYRGDEDAEPLLMELGRQLYLLDETGRKNGRKWRKQRLKLISILCGETEKLHWMRLKAFLKW